MADLEQLQQAFLAADSAGNVEDATMFASEISRLTSAAPMPTAQADITQSVEQVQPMQDETQPQQDQGFLAGIQEQITGTQRATPETEALGDWASMPEMNTFSMASFKSALGTMLTNPEETVQVIKANYPEVQVRQDERGNYLLRSSIDGQEYAIKPGFQLSDIPRAAGAMAAFTPAGAARTIGGAALGAGLTQAGIEATQAATGGEFDPKEVALAGALGGAGQAVGKGAQAVRGMIGGTTPGMKAAQQAVKSSEAIGIKPMTSDVLPPTTFAGKSAQVLGERIPVVGTGPVRAVQQVKRVDAVRNVLREYGALDAANASDDVMKDLLVKRSKDITKYSSLKNDVINKLSTAGKVPLSKTNKTIESEIGALQSLRSTESAKGAAVLDDFKNAFQNQDLKNIEALRKQLGEKLSDPDLSAVKGDLQKSVGRIYKSLKDDMGEFIKSTGDRRDITKWKVGNAQLSKMIGDLQNTTLKSALKKGDMTPENIRSMLFSKKPSDIQSLARGLTPKGRANARTAILQEVAEKSGGLENLSPQKFATQLGKLDKSFQVFFSGKDKKVIDGLLKSLQLTRRAADAEVFAPTGAQLSIPVGAAVLTDMLGTVGGGLAAGASIGSVARIYESKPIRDILIKISLAPKGKEQELIKQLTKVMQAQQISNKEEQ